MYLKTLKVVYKIGLRASALVIVGYLILCFGGCTRNQGGETAAHRVLLDTIYSPGIHVVDTESTHAYSFPKNQPGTKAGIGSIRKADYLLAMQHYTAEQGLALSSVLCSYRDSKGVMWFGTNGGGVSRFEGKSFYNYTTEQGLGNNAVYCILEDWEGNFWFGTENGISRFDGKTFTNFTLSTTPGLTNNTILCMLQDKAGNLWFGTNGGGVCKYNKQNFIGYGVKEGLCGASIYSMCQSSDGSIWFGGLSGVSCFSNGSFKTFNKPKGLIGDSVYSIVDDNKGSIWFGTNNGVCSLTNGTITTPEELKVLAHTSIWSIYKDHWGKLWFASNHGVALFNGYKVAVLTTNQGLSSNNVLCITEDQKHNLWLGTYDGGLNRYYGDAIESFSENQGFNNSLVFSIVEDRSKNLWFGTAGKGIVKFDGENFENYSTAQGLCSNKAYCQLQDIKGYLWVGTQGNGVSRYSATEGFTSLTKLQGLADNEVWCMTQDRKNNLWFGTSNGLSRYDGKKFTTFRKEDGLGDNHINALAADTLGNIWVGTQEGGVSCICSSTDSGRTVVVNFTKKQGLVTNLVYSILSDATGNVWFGTDDGISILPFEYLKRVIGNSLQSATLQATAAPSIQQSSPFINLSIKDGLSNNVIMGFAEDHHKNIFVGTNAGLTVIRGGGAGLRNGKRDVTFEVFNAKTGYPIKDINTNAIYCDRQDYIWVGTGDKLIRFNYNAIQHDTLPPSVLIQSVRVNDAPISWDDLHTQKSSVLGEYDAFGKLLSESERDTLRKKFGDIQFDGVSAFYFLPQHLVLPFNHNHIRFDFAAIETGKFFMTRYQYKLEGYDESWSPITDQTFAEFGNMHEGDYTFKVKTCGAEGYWSNVVTYSFRVTPPWYRKWYMYFCYFVLLGLAFYIFTRSRTAKLRREKSKLERLVKIRTAEVVLQKDEAEKQKELVVEKNKEITDSINYARRIQQAILSHEDASSKQLPEHFILLKPKDIVSGDFYWSIEKNGYWYIAAADCTGHGVPGAFMSMLGIAFLNEITAGEKLLSPAEILDRLRAKIVKELHQTGASGESKDGMDISLACLNLTTRELQWAGANNSVYIVNDSASTNGATFTTGATFTNGGAAIREKGNSLPAVTLKEIKGDKQPIGYHHQFKEFTNHTIELVSGNVLYLFTDGYADQFGGPAGKKFMYQRFENLLISIAHLNVHEQKHMLATTFEDWKKDLEQLDDVCVIGIRI